MVLEIISNDRNTTIVQNHSNVFEFQCNCNSMGGFPDVVQYIHVKYEFILAMQW